MSYTNTWNSGAPLGSIAAATLDDEIRKLRVDLEDRLEDKFVTDITLDPLVVKPEILGNVTGKRIIIHNSAFLVIDNTDQITNRGKWSSSNAYVESSAAATALAEVVLQVSAGNITITKFEFLADARGAGTITGRLRKTLFGPIPTDSEIASTTVGGTGITMGTISVSAISTTDSMYYARIDLPAAGMRVYGVAVTYTTPDCRATI